MNTGKPRTVHTVTLYKASEITITEDTATALFRKIEYAGDFSGINYIDKIANIGYDKITYQVVSGGVRSTFKNGTIVLSGDIIYCLVDNVLYVYTELGTLHKKLREVLDVKQQEPGDAIMRSLVLRWFDDDVKTHDI